MTRLLTLVPVLAFVLISTGCDGEFSRGIVINTETGKMGANTAANERETLQDTLRLSIQNDLGAGWTATVAIAEVPVPDQERMTDAFVWRWQRITARITITPPTGVVLADAKRSELLTDVRKYLLRKMDHPKDESLLSLELTTAVAAIAPAAAPAQPMSPAGPRRYVLQVGDTLADVSTAFYGSPQHWRAIVAANPGLDPAGLNPGQSLVIPLLEAPAPTKP